MDYEFRANEMGTDPEDRKYRNWLNAVGAILGGHVEEGTRLESDLFDFYSNELTPAEAAEELRAIVNID